MVNGVRLVLATWSAESERTVTPTEAAASMTFGAGYEPAVTKPSIWPFFSAAPAFDNSESAMVT